jgi:hypothetical protein
MTKNMSALERLAALENPAPQVALAIKALAAKHIAVLSGRLPGAPRTARVSVRQRLRDELARREAAAEGVRD